MLRKTNLIVTEGCILCMLLDVNVIYPLIVAIRLPISHLFSSLSHIPVCIPLAFASRHKARSLDFQIFCSVGGIGPPCLYSHRLCSRNMLHSSIGVTSFVCILLGFKSMTLTTLWLICIILENY